MAKARIDTPEGAKIQISGTAEEVALLLARFSTAPTTDGKAPSSGHRTSRKAKPGVIAAAKRKDGPTSLISTLADENFFKSKRSLSDIQKKLEELGHIYAQTSLSPILTRLTRKRVLRRIKEKDGWMYVA